MITFVKTLGGKTHFKAVHIQEPNQIPVDNPHYPINLHSCPETQFELEKPTTLFNNPKR